MGWAIALSVGLHSVLFGWMTHPHSGGSQSGAALATRMLVAVYHSAQQEPTPVAEPVAPTPQPKPVPVDAAAARSAPTALAPEPKPIEPLPVTVTRSLPPAPSYHGGPGLNPPPRFLNDIEPQYPESALMVEGSVVLRFLISATGEVEDVAVLRSSPPGTFDEAALRAYSKARFSPGYLLGVPVKSQKIIEVLFTPTNRGGAIDATAQIPSR